MNDRYMNSISLCIDFINKQMLTFDNGYYGIYERIRIDLHARTNWSRPDTNAEYLRVLMTHQTLTGDKSNEALIENLINWLLRTQDVNPFSVWKGSFPFYLIDGQIVENKSGVTLYQNDNGKILTIMCQLYETYKDKRFLTIAKGIAEYWCKVQQEDGTFGMIDSKNMFECAKGPCFVHWLTSGLFLLYKITKEAGYLKSANKGIEYIKATIATDGHSKTSFELIKMEDWRPVSSETAMAFYCFCTAYTATDDSTFLDYANKTGDFLVSLQHANGAILNCNESCMDNCPQTNPDIADLVYTEGFALQAFLLAFKCTSNKKWLVSAKKLSDFLVSIQCADESPLWDGGWRGSYNVVSGKWDGRANQNNSIDEGGLYSVYTGWCCCNIMYGLQLLLSHKE